MIFFTIWSCNFIIGKRYIYIYRSKRGTRNFLFQTLLAPKLFVEIPREREEQQLETTFNRNTFFFFYFRLIQPYPRLLLSYSHSSSSVESGLSGHSIIWVIRGYRFLPSIEAHQPNILHRNILIAINNCRRDNTTLARIHPSPPPSSLPPSSWKNFRINYRADYRTGMEFRHLTSG